MAFNWKNLQDQTLQTAELRRYVDQLDNRVTALEPTTSQIFAINDTIVEIWQAIEELRDKDNGDDDDDD